MGTLITILAVLFLSLIVVIPLIEKYAPKSEEGQDFSKYSRWIIPLLILLLVAQLLRYAFG